MQQLRNVSILRYIIIIISFISTMIVRGLINVLT